MSIDPALKKIDNSINFLQSESIIIADYDVIILDFDGVVSSSLEDNIYRLEGYKGENFLLEKAAQHFNMHCNGMEWNFIRHLVIQAAFWKLKRPIEINKFFFDIKNKIQSQKIFILTARSGWYSVERGCGHSSKTINLFL